MDPAIPTTGRSRIDRRPRNWSICGALVFLALSVAPALAQRAGENAVTSASDAFGTSVGDERIGLYAEDSVRGFSPITAGNRRIEGMYIDLQGPGITRRLISGSVVRVGLAALSYPFPAPSGIVDYQLRPAGDEVITSLVVGRPAYGGGYAEVDAQIPIRQDRLTLAAGAAYSYNEYQDGRTTDYAATAFIPRLRFDGGSLTAFWTYTETSGDVVPVMVTAGPYLPRDFAPGRFLGQDWADRLQRTHTYGAIGELKISGAWNLHAAAFESRSTRYRSFIDLFVGVQPDGSARNIVISEPELPARWTSGDVRLSWTSVGEAAAHQVHFSLRGRDKEVEQGGGAAVDLGPAWIGVANPAPEPDFAFQPTTLNSVSQWAAGAAYLGRWGRFAEFNVGVQTTDYRQTVERNGAADSSDAYDLLYSASLCIAADGMARVLRRTCRGPGRDRRAARGRGQSRRRAARLRNEAVGCARPARARRYADRRGHLRDDTALLRDRRDQYLFGARRDAQPRC